MFAGKENKDTKEQIFIRLLALSELSVVGGKVLC
jgi:hypothetical protein